METQGPALAVIAVNCSILGNEYEQRAPPLLGRSYENARKCPSGNQAVWVHESEVMFRVIIITISMMKQHRNGSSPTNAVHKLRF